MAKMGRPTIRTPEIEADIVRRLMRGETLKRMCETEAHLPHRDTVHDWQASDPDFADRLVRAREVGSHALIEENRDIADDGTNDWMEILDAKGQPTGAWKVNGEAVQRSKLRIDQRWREAEAILPKVYGKRQTIEHAGGISLSLTSTSDEDLVNEIAELLATGRLKLPSGIELVDVEAEDEEDFSDIA